MSDHVTAYRALEDSVVAWASRQPDVHAVLVVGSRARADRPADEYSDLDLVMFAADPDRFIDRDDWLVNIGPVVMSFVEQTAVGSWRERRAVFEPMLDVDFAVVPATMLDIDFSVPGPVADVVRPVIDRGYRVIHDPAGRLAPLDRILPSPATAWTLPDEWAFTNLVNDFWYHALWTRKKALRGELLVARSCLDNSMKDKVLHVINWLAHLGKPDLHTWNGKRFFELWSEQDIVQSFHATYGTVSSAQILDDLSRTMDLFSRVARDAAHRLDYSYPERAEGHVRDWIRTTLTETAAHD